MSLSPISSPSSGFPFPCHGLLPQALETFVLRCPHDVTSDSSSILALALEYLSYDPNFTDDDADAMDEDRGFENGDEEDEYAPPCHRTLIMQQGLRTFKAQALSELPFTLQVASSRGIPRVYRE